MEKIVDTKVRTPRAWPSRYFGSLSHLLLDMALNQRAQTGFGKFLQPPLDVRRVATLKITEPRTNNFRRSLNRIVTVPHLLFDFVVIEPKELHLGMLPVVDPSNSPSYLW
jgi:hypothetical protein